MQTFLQSFWQHSCTEKTRSRTHSGVKFFFCQHVLRHTTKHDNFLFILRQDYLISVSKMFPDSEAAKIIKIPISVA